MIRAEGLTRHFKTRNGTVEAVKGIDLEVEEGELVAFLGPNGAGKTTTLRMLTTLLAPTAGTARVAGRDIRTQPTEVRHRIGYVGQGNGGGHSQRARDELVTQGRCYGMNTRRARQRADELLESLALTGLGARKVSTLSGGQRRRLDVALGLMQRPPLLFLDEPSTGLDPHNRANLWEHITRMRAEAGTTIVLTTHYLEEADSEAERVVVIDHGEIIADGTSAELKAGLAGDKIMLRAEDDVAAKRSAEVVGALVPDDDVSVVDSAVTVRTTHGERLVPALVRALDAADVPPVAVELDHPTLDDVFLALTGRSLREDETSE